MLLCTARSYLILVQWKKNYFAKIWRGREGCRPASPPWLLRAWDYTGSGCYRIKWLFFALYLRGFALILESKLWAKKLCALFNKIIFFSPYFFSQLYQHLTVRNLVHSCWLPSLNPLCVYAEIILSNLTVWKNTYHIILWVWAGWGYLHPSWSKKCWCQQNK